MELNNSTLPSDEAVPLISLLKVLGHTPVFSVGEDTHFTGVLGNPETNQKSTFKVNHRLNFWYDSHLGKGGNLMDFAQAYWPESTVEEITSRLAEIARRLSGGSEEKPRRRRKALRVPHYRIERTGPLGYNDELNRFLRLSGLWELADLRMQEVYYYLLDQKGLRKDFCAVGWQNENGGWEIRAQHFEGCIGTKGMTFISQSSRTLNVFHRYIDYLNVRRTDAMHFASALILNHPHFLSAAIKRSARFGKVHFYLDRNRKEDETLSSLFSTEVPHSVILRF